MAGDGVNAARRPPGVVAARTGSSVVAHAAFQHEDLLVTAVAVAGDDRARRVAHEHGLPLALGPQHLPVHAGTPLLPGLLADGHVEARGRSHGTSTSTASPTTRRSSCWKA